MVQAKQSDAVNRKINDKSSVGADALTEDVCYVEVKCCISWKNYMWAASDRGREPSNKTVSMVGQ